MSYAKRMGAMKKLRAEMAELSEQVKELHRELARSAAGGFRAMRDTRRCPACGGGRLLHIPAATELASRGAAPLTIHHLDGWWGATSKGPIEHFVCRGCMLIESHVTDLDGIEPDGKTVIAIEPEPEVPPGSGPFR